MSPRDQTAPYSASPHPRPQLVRNDWSSLDGAWEFMYDDDDLGLQERWFAGHAFDRTITVPFPPESPASGIGDPGFHPVLWYRRHFVISRPAPRQMLHFGAVDYRASVWVNGQLVATHEGGHTPFSADISGALLEAEREQTVVVRAEDDPEDLAQPRGKQYWKAEPESIFYQRTSGIWQSVWLEGLPATFIETLRWTPDLDCGTLGLHLGLNAAPRTSAALRLQVRLTLGTHLLCDDSYGFEGCELRRAISLDPTGTALRRQEYLWSPEAPNLIQAHLRLLRDDTVIDEVASYAGMRSAHVADGRFLLNGTPYYPRLVLAQGYWPESHLAAPSPQALELEARAIKDLGFNGVRIHQKLEDPRFLAACDHIGLLVWGEMANAYTFSETAAERLLREWLEALRRDYSHPCVVTWVPMNESWGAPNLERDPAQRDFVRALYYTTKALDPSRPTIGNDGWEHLAADIWGIHEYALDPEVILERYGSAERVRHTLRAVTPHYRNLILGGGRHSGEPVMLSECGGLGFHPVAGEQWFGYATVSDEAAFLERYAALIGAVLACPTIAGFCYTQLTDTGQETNGLLRADRTPKVDATAIRRINCRASSAIPGEAITALQDAGMNAGGATTEV